MTSPAASANLFATLAKRSSSEPLCSMLVTAPTPSESVDRVVVIERIRRDFVKARVDDGDEDNDDEQQVL